jgi:hypothetical protein
MARSFRGIIESIVYAGMKPGAPAAQVQRHGRFARLRTLLDRWLVGSAAPSDPLYLTRRTIGQRIMRAAVIATPCLIVAGFIVLALNRYFVKTTPVPKMDMAPGEIAAIAAKMLPNMDHVKLDTNRDVDVLEVHVDHSKGLALTGTVMNNTSHRIETAEIIFDLTDATGSQLGGVSQRVENLAPQARQTFRLPIEQRDASFVLVREVRTR